MNKELVKEKLKETRLFIAAPIIALVWILIFVGQLVYLRYVAGLPWADWTGFGDYTGSLPNDARAKTLFGLLDLIIVTVLLALGAYWFNQQQKKRDTQIETDRQREAALQYYLAAMSTLLIDKKLRESYLGDVRRDVARSQTLTTLRMLDPTREGLLVRFLHESELIT